MHYYVTVAGMRWYIRMYVPPRRALRKWLLVLPHRRVAAGTTTRRSQRFFSFFYFPVSKCGRQQRGVRNLRLAIEFKGGIVCLQEEGGKFFLYWGYAVKHVSRGGETAGVSNGDMLRSREERWYLD